MATCTTMTTRDPFPRAPTPRPPPSSYRVITKRSSYQSLNSPVLMSPVRNEPFSPLSPVEIDWPLINVISPSTASHHSLYSDTEDDFRSPRLALLTSDLEGEPEGFNKLISPSAPIPQPGDELLYDIAFEEKPDESFFNPDFQAALAKTKQEMKDISMAIWGCPASHQPGSDLHALKQRALQLSEFEPEQTKTIALVGDSGNGKCGVINALLDQPYLVHSSDAVGGSLSPSIITEYKFRPAQHNEPFAIEVDYSTPSEIKELIEELLRTFRAYYEPAFKILDDEEERREIRRRSETAWTMLLAMFRNQPIFSKDFVLQEKGWKTEQHGKLSFDYHEDDEAPIVDVLQQWASEFLDNRPGGKDAPTWSAAAFNLDECVDKLDAFVTNPVDDRTPALWPFVRVVRVYLRSPILQSGVVLVDCPTPRDLNFVSSRGTERYLRNCHEIIAVTTMERALSDKTIQNIISRIGRHRLLSIICTESETLSARNIERRDPEVSLQVRTWRQQIEAFRMQVKRNEAQRRHNVPGALEEEIRVRDMLEEMEFGLKKFLVERRNGQVASQLIHEYAECIQVGDLKVFCVSGTDYWEHRYDEQQRAVSRLELSGIVDLRKYCHSVPVEAQFEAAAAFMEHDVPAFLGSLQQWAVEGTESIAAEKAAEIRQVMKELEEAAIQKLILPSASIHVTKTNLNHEFASAIVLPIREHRSEWRNAALDANKEWTKWDAKDYLAFCRHYGIHSTKSIGHRNWNEELIAPMRLQLQSNWGFFNETLEESQKEIIHAIEQVFDELSAPLQELLPVAPTSIRTLLSTLPNRLASISITIRSSFTTLLHATQNLESDALYGHLSSYISSLLEPAYHAVSALPTTSPLVKPSLSSTSPPHSPSPTLLDQQRKELITTHIASFRIFPKLSTAIEKAHRTLVHEAFERMAEGITREVDALVRDMNLVVGGEGEKSEAERYAAFACGLRARLQRAEEVIRGMKEVVGNVRGVYAVDECASGGLRGVEEQVDF